MPKANSSKKTASAPKISQLVLAVLVIVLSAVALAGYRFQTNQATCLMPPGNSGCINLEQAVTPEQQAKGLSGRDSLAPNAGMLFVFKKSGQYCFWMKDMHFPLDIIWSNEQKQVVYLQHNLSPSTYPRTFCPNQEARYVIELNAGSAQKNQINQGTKLNF